MINLILYIDACISNVVQSVVIIVMEKILNIIYNVQLELLLKVNIRLVILHVHHVKY